MALGLVATKIMVLLCKQEACRDRLRDVRGLETALVGRLGSVMVGLGAMVDNPWQLSLLTWAAIASSSDLIS